MSLPRSSAFVRRSRRASRPVPFDPERHPRGRGGRFVDVHAIARRVATTLGSTPYQVSRDTHGPRHGFAAAQAVREDPDFKALAKSYEADARSLARKHDVKLLSITPNVGVFEGNFEPSYAIRVKGDDEKVKAYNAELGHKYGQDAVVGFRRDATGSDAEVTFRNVEDPDAFYRDLVAAMPDAGATFDPNQVRVFVANGDQKAIATLKALAVNAHDVRYRRGVSHYIETGGPHPLNEGEDKTKSDLHRALDAMGAVEVKDGEDEGVTEIVQRPVRGNV